MSRLCSVIAITFGLCLIQGCSNPSTPPTNATKIKHIVVIMQENRTVDNLFNGFPGADTVQTATQKGVTVQLKPITLEQGEDVDHSHLAWVKAYDNGLLDNFGHDGYGTFPYAYVPQSETVPYFTLAKDYTFGDRMFQSNTGASFIAHQYMIAGQSANVDENPNEYPWGCDSPPGTTVSLIGPNGTDLPGGFPCFDYQTMADLLDAKAISWKYYSVAITPIENRILTKGDIWSAFDAIKHIRYGPDWTKNVISPPAQFFTDIQNGNLAQVTWIMPALSYSDHAGYGSGADGPDWVANLVNAIGSSPFWDSTVIFISWDDWGGWYDHVPPPQVDAMGLGSRVPLIIVSPYAKHAYISETTHEFSGFLTYTEETFNLGNLGQRDVKADDFADCFDYTQTPQPYTAVPVTKGPAYFLAQKNLTIPDDD